MHEMYNSYNKMASKIKRSQTASIPLVLTLSPLEKIVIGIIIQIAFF
jgi:hypothetical protein